MTDIKWFCDGTTHPCRICGNEIINLFTDESCVEESLIEGDEVCVPCEDFGGPIDDMDLWDN